MRPWIVMSSSSGQTFSKLYEFLNADEQKSLGAAFVDRDCGASEIFSQIENVHVGKFERKECEQGVLDWIANNDFENGLILLCGYFGILSAEFIEKCGAPIVNTHPSLLPAFPGLDKKVHKLAWENVAVSGFTIHVVTAELDGGPTLFQQPVRMDANWSEDEARDAIRDVEQRLIGKFWQQILHSELSVEDKTKTSIEVRKKCKF